MCEIKAPRGTLDYIDDSTHYAVPYPKVEVEEWFKENDIEYKLTSRYEFHPKYNHESVRIVRYYFHFNKSEDATLFSLRWG